MLIDEYDLSNESTWTVLPAPYVDPSFDRALIEIAGLNPFGKPILLRRWASTYRDPQNSSGALKYFLTNTAPTLSGFEYEENGQTVRVKLLADVPTHVLVLIPKYESHQLGERRWIIEQWRSAEFLAKTGRYKLTHDTGETETQTFCKNCSGQEFVFTGREDERKCVVCHSTRQRIVEFKEVKNERLLNDFPSEGCYDFFLRLQTEDGTDNGLYRPCDGKALEDIRRLWAHQQKAFQEQEAMRNKLVAQAAKQKNQRIDKIWATS